MPFDPNRGILFQLFGTEVPPGSVGSAVPSEEPRAAPATGCPCERPCSRSNVHQLGSHLDPDLLEEILEAQADRELFEEY